MTAVDPSVGSSDQIESISAAELLDPIISVGEEKSVAEDISIIDVISESDITEGAVECTAIVVFEEVRQQII